MFWAIPGVEGDNVVTGCVEQKVHFRKCIDWNTKANTGYWMRTHMLLMISGMLFVDDVLPVASDNCFHRLLLSERSHI